MMQAVTILVLLFAGLVYGQQNPDGTEAPGGFPCPAIDCVPSDSPITCPLNPCSLPDYRCPEGIVCCPDSCTCSRSFYNSDGARVEDSVCTSEVFPTTEVPTDPCALILCDIPDCPPGFSPETPEGHCCPRCTRERVCPPDPSTLPGIDGFACSQRCESDDDCEGTLGNLACCEVETCGHKICRIPVDSMCYDEYLGQSFAAGAEFYRDMCHECECLRNGSIVCEESCEIMGCPDEEPNDFSICPVECGTDRPCPNENEMCCMNSCGGGVCREVEIMCRTPLGEFVAPGDTFMRDCNTCTCMADGTAACTEIFCPTLGCPAVSDDASAVACTIPFEESCGSYSSGVRCDDDQICCNVTRGCAPACVTPVTVCYLDAYRTLQVGETRTDRTICKTCTCQDTGELICEPTPNCQTCEQNGMRYLEGERVPSNDACNTCSCQEGNIVCTEYVDGDRFQSDCNNCTCTVNGTICTLAFCIPPCFQVPEVVGNCDAAFPRWSFDPTTGTCSQFTWGGCGGNQNNFENQIECLETCNPRSSCLAPIYEQEPLCRIASVVRWTYNIESGECERIDYIPCQAFDPSFNVYFSEDQCERACIDGDDSECPEDIPLVFCFADPCSVNRCPNYPDARCQSNYCGGCNAWFFSDGENVTDRCDSNPSCPDGSPLLDCFIDPCEVARCPQNPEARCRPNYCGECSAQFFDGDQEITDNCLDNNLPIRPTPLQFLQCPTLPEGTIGTCAQECSTSQDCEDGEACCSNGCGRTCQRAISIPYYDIPAVCPMQSFNDFVSICQFDEDDNCLQDNECDDDELCCNAGCGKVCTDAEKSSQPCFDIFDRLVVFDHSQNAAGLVGVYIPSCADDGLYAPIQTHGSTGSSWCVDVRTGVPISDSLSSTPENIPECPTCTEGDAVYHVGQSFPHSDGCNTCTCTATGMSVCTRRACVPTCEQEPDPGPCRASFPAYYYDSSSERCEQFTYGGCEGNDNRFFTLAACMRQCQPDSVCLRPRDAVQCEERVEEIRYFFNTTTGRCEEYFARGCVTDNSFTSGEECVRRCDPEGDYIPDCTLIQCDIPICDDDEFFSPDPTTCCGGVCTELECDDDEVLCRDGSRCIDESYICDDFEDCDDGSDERGCPPDILPGCRGRYTCESSRECIPYDYLCDSVADCRDGSDERNCSGSTLPDNTRYFDNIPLECPPATDFLMECFDDESCSNNLECPEEQICCPSSCGTKQCTVGVPVTPLCSNIVRELVGMSTGPPLLGVFTPECDREGLFLPVQCHEGYCWCVDVQSGLPLDEGTRTTDANNIVCRGCEINDNTFVPFGATYTHSDGCRTCFCTPLYPENEVCTIASCPVACTLGEIKINHTDTYEDECIKCACQFGSLDCDRKDCASVAPIRDNARVRMPFNGNFDAIMTRPDEFRREWIRTLVGLYGDSMGLRQNQIVDVEFERGSVIVIVELADSESVDSANLTALLSQLQQDYTSGTIVIRFGDTALQPTGEFVIINNAITQPWVIAVIVIAGVLAIVALVAIIIAIVACMRARKSGRGPEYSGKASANDYDHPVSYKPNTEEVKVPLD